MLGSSLVVQWLRLCVPHAGGLGSVTGHGTRSCILQWKPGTAKWINIFFQKRSKRCTTLWFILPVTSVRVNCSSSFTMHFQKWCWACRCKRRGRSPDTFFFPSPQGAYPETMTSVTGMVRIAEGGYSHQWDLSWDVVLAKSTPRDSAATPNISDFPWITHYSPVSCSLWTLGWKWKC